MFACIRHASWFKPTIQNFRDTGQGIASCRIFYFYQVYIMFMKIDFYIEFLIEIFSISLFYLTEILIEFVKLFYRSNTQNLRLIFRSPKWHSWSPISITWDIPVSCILYPFTKSSCLYILRYPIYLFIILYEPWWDIFDFDIPCAYSSVYKRSFTSVAMRIWVIYRTYIYYDFPIF